jgi:hypothetical protein
MRLLKSILRAISADKVAAVMAAGCNAVICELPERTLEVATNVAWESYAG